jgi:hypothetical protein
MSRCTRGYRCPNPRWAQGCGGDHAYVPPPQSEFEEVAARLSLSPEQYADSAQLRTWVKQNCRRKIVPEGLLTLWGLSAVVYDSE